MSFLRHARSIGPIGHVKTILQFRLCTASRGSAPGSTVGRGCDTAPSLIVRDEYAPAIPWRVALQQSPPLFHRMGPFCYERICRSRSFHRTANSGLTGCLTSGVHFRLCSIQVRWSAMYVYSQTLKRSPLAGLADELCPSVTKFYGVRAQKWAHIGASLRCAKDLSHDLP